MFGFFFIDNGAHLGGALAGALVGLAAAPSDAAVEFEPTIAADAAGWLASAVLLGGALFTIWRVLP